MKHTVKRTLTTLKLKNILLLFSMALALSACSGGNNSETDTASITLQFGNGTSAASFVRGLTNENLFTLMQDDVSMFADCGGTGFRAMTNIKVNGRTVSGKYPAANCQSPKLETINIKNPEGEVITVFSLGTSKDQQNRFYRLDNSQNKIFIKEPASVSLSTTIKQRNGSVEVGVVVSEYCYNFDVEYSETLDAVTLSGKTFSEDNNATYSGMWNVDPIGLNTVDASKGSDLSVKFYNFQQSLPYTYELGFRYGGCYGTLTVNVVE